MNVTVSNEPQPLVTKREAMALLKVSLRTIDRYLADGTLNPVRLSSRATRIKTSDIEALIAPEPAEPSKVTS